VKVIAILAGVGVALAWAAMVRGGHEMSVYPSFYPHDIRIETMSPQRAARLLADSSIQAYIGHSLSQCRQSSPLARS